MWAYCDASALVKCYLQEPGRSTVLRLLKRRRLVSSQLVVVELRSGLSRHARERDLTKTELDSVTARVAADRARWALVQADGDVLDVAEAIVAIHPVRTLDAIHVASAQLFAQRVPSDMVFVSADRRQLDAARSVGLVVADVSGRPRRGRISSAAR